MILAQYAVVSVLICQKMESFVVNFVRLICPSIVQLNTGHSTRKMRHVFYGGLQLSGKKITVMFTVKRKDSRKNKRPRGKKKKTHCKRKNLPVPTLSFMPRKHCYFFCREVISLAVSLLLLICREGYSFCREVFSVQP